MPSIRFEPQIQGGPLAPGAYQTHVVPRANGNGVVLATAFPTRRAVGAKLAVEDYSILVTAEDIGGESGSHQVAFNVVNRGDAQIRGYAVNVAIISP